MSEYKYIYVITKNDSVNEVKSLNDVSDFYSDSLKYLILVNKAFYKESYLSTYDTGYQFNVLVKDSENQDAIISYGNFKLRFLFYQKNINKRNVSYYVFDGFEYEIIDNEGNCFGRSAIASMLEKKSFEKDFRGQDWNISKLSSIINLLSFIKSFNDLKEVEEIFMSYK